MNLSWVAASENLLFHLLLLRVDSSFWTSPTGHSVWLSVTVLSQARRAWEVVSALCMMILESFWTITCAIFVAGKCSLKARCWFCFLIFAFGRWNSPAAGCRGCCRHLSFGLVFRSVLSLRDPMDLSGTEIVLFGRFSRCWPSSLSVLCFDLVLLSSDLII